MTELVQRPSEGKLTKAHAGMVSQTKRKKRKKTKRKTRQPEQRRRRTQTEMRQNLVHHSSRLVQFVSTAVPCEGL